MIYNVWKKNALLGNPDLSAGAVKMLLTKPSYVFDPTNVFVSDIAPVLNEVTGTYARQTLTTKTFTQDNVNSRGVFKFDNVVFAALDAGTIGGGIFYREVTNDSDSILLWFVTVGKPSNSGDMTFAVPALGAAWCIEG